MSSETPWSPDGYRVLRPLAIRAGSEVHLASNPSGTWCALKLQQVSRSDSVEFLMRDRRRLLELSRQPGFVAVVEWGWNSDKSILWEEMPLADNVDGKPFSAEQAEIYTPLSLALWLMEHRRATTAQSVAWGLRLTDALDRLHQLGLLHRDVKPSNMLFFGGELCISDYGSIGQPGDTVEFPGTEGYVPPDGMGSPATDVFALGRTLYEVWTGKDRFQFPSLPPEVTSSAEWARHGWRLNEVLLRAADGRPSRRFTAAGQLGEALRAATPGRTQVSRRRLIEGTIGVGLAVGGFYIWKNRAPFRAVWKRLPFPDHFGVEAWAGTNLTCDWKRRICHSLQSFRQGLVYGALDLTTWKLEEKIFTNDPKQIGHSIFLPKSGELWGINSENGVIARIHPSPAPTPPTLSLIASHPINELNFAGLPYFNPVTGRIGSFGGYGNFSFHNRRKEFDLPTETWVNVVDGGGVPWPRTGGFLFPGATPDQWLLAGGSGNNTGKQGDRVPGLRAYNGNAHSLNDLWLLQLDQNRWTQLLGVQVWAPDYVQGVLYHPGSSGVVHLARPVVDRGASPWLSTFHWTSGEPGVLPRALPSSGDPASTFGVWSLLLDPDTQQLWVLSSQGVFTVSLVPA